MSAPKAGNGFVAGKNYFVALGPTKQFAENLNDFSGRRQLTLDLQGTLGSAGDP